MHRRHNSEMQLLVCAVYTIGTLQAPLYYIHYDLLSLQDLPFHTALLIITLMYIMYVGS